MLFVNGQIVTPTEVFLGSVEASAGTIQRIGAGTSSAAAGVDLEGDFLLPGLIDIHTDALEGHMTPRSGVQWPVQAAVASHDAQMAASEVTTVFDSLPLGAGGEQEDAIRNRVRCSVDELQQQNARRLRAEHFLHLRLEVSNKDTPEVFEEFLGSSFLRLVSLMDHTPGQGQYEDLARWHSGAFRGRKTAEELEEHLRKRIEAQ